MIPIVGRIASVNVLPQYSTAYAKLFMSVAYVIRWSLLGSYVCFITTQLTTVGRFITVILYTCRYQTTTTTKAVSHLMLSFSKTLTLTSTSRLTLYTVLCSFLNMCLEQVSLVGRSWSLVGACDLWLGFLLQCIRQSNGSIFWDHSPITKRLVHAIAIVE